MFLPYNIIRQTLYSKWSAVVVWCVQTSAAAQADRSHSDPRRLARCVHRQTAHGRRSLPRDQPRESFHAQVS
jgi:hypothetical protein